MRHLLRELDTSGGVVRGTGRDWPGRSRSIQQLLANFDQPRRHDLDGRGRLSVEALGAFTDFFLRACLDQVRFMQSLLRLAFLASLAGRLDAGAISGGASLDPEAYAARLVELRANAAQA